MQIMKISEFQYRTTKNNENLKNPCGNYKNHENHENPRENQENHEKSLCTLESQQKYKNLRIPKENQ